MCVSMSGALSGPPAARAAPAAGASAAAPRPRAERARVARNVRRSPPRFVGPLITRGVADSFMLLLQGGPGASRPPTSAPGPRAIVPRQAGPVNGSGFKIVLSRRRPPRLWQAPLGTRGLPARQVRPHGFQGQKDGAEGDDDHADH